MHTAIRTLLSTPLVLGAFCAVGIAANTHDAPEGGWVFTDPAFQSIDRGQPDSLAWTKADAQAFPGCVESTGQPGLLFVVATLSADRVVMDLGDVDQRNNGTADKADDVWVVGVC